MTNKRKVQTSGEVVTINEREYKVADLSTTARNCIMLIRRAEGRLADAEQDAVIARLALQALHTELERALVAPPEKQ